MKWNRTIAGRCGALLLAAMLAQTASAQMEVKDVANPDQNGWQRGLYITSSTNEFFSLPEFSRALGTVPAGKRLVVDYVTGRYSFNGGDSGYCQIGIRLPNGSSSNFFLPAPTTVVDRSNTVIKTFSGPMRMFSAAGEVKLYCNHDSGPGKVMGVWISVMGHLIEATPANNPFD